MDVLADELPDVPVYVTFDTAFHRTLPETAWRYPIDRETADRHGVRKFGFHGVSHRERGQASGRGDAAPGKRLVGVRDCGQAVGGHDDGLTPLEGLMMGSRSGSIDPAILPYLMRKEGESAEEILTLLNKQSGMLGIAGGSLDTRELVKRGDPAAKLALAMFSHWARLAVGAYLAALGDAEAVIFGGGIGEDSPWLREDVCAGLGGWGLELDREVNDRSVAGMARISKEGSRLHGWAMPVEEGLQIAHECLIARKNEGE